MPNGLHHTIQHREELLFPVSNNTLVFFGAFHGVIAFLTCLFLTPCLLLGYGILTKEAFLLRLAIFATSSVYVFLVCYIIYAIATFKDS